MDNMQQFITERVGN